VGAGLQVQTLRDMNENPKVTTVNRMTKAIFDGDKET
jgi:hypothetical protein